MTAANFEELGVPGVAYHAAEKVITARRPAEGWTIGNPVEALRPGELIIGNFARQRQMEQAQATPQLQLS